MANTTDNYQWTKEYLNAKYNIPMDILNDVFTEVGEHDSQRHIWIALRRRGNRVIPNEDVNTPIDTTIIT